VGFLVAVGAAARGAGRATAGLLAAVEALAVAEVAGRPGRWPGAVKVLPRRETLLGMLGKLGAAAVRLFPRISLMSQALRLRLSLARLPIFMGSGEAARTGER